MEHLLEQCREEIRSLRRDNEMMSGQLRIVEIFEMALRQNPHGMSRGAGLDIVYAIERKLDELRNQSAAANKIQPTAFE